MRRAGPWRGRGRRAVGDFVGTGGRGRGSYRGCSQSERRPRSGRRVPRRRRHGDLRTGDAWRWWAEESSGRGKLSFLARLIDRLPRGQANRTGMPIVPKKLASAGKTRKIKKPMKRAQLSPDKIRWWKSVYHLAEKLQGCAGTGGGQIDQLAHQDQARIVRPRSCHGNPG